MYRNVAGQTVGTELLNTDGTPFTGTADVYVSGDGGAQVLGSVGGGASTHRGNGYHVYFPSAGETDYAQVAFTFTAVGIIPQSIPYEPRRISSSSPSPPSPPPPPEVANFGFDAFDFFVPTIDGVPVEAIRDVTWSTQQSRSGGNKEAGEVLHQYLPPQGQETTLYLRFTPKPSAVDISSWAFGLDLTKRPFTGAPITTLVDTSLIRLDESQGVVFAALSLKKADGVEPDRYVASLYRTDVDMELSEVYFRVYETGANPPPPPPPP